MGESEARLRMKRKKIPAVERLEFDHVWDKLTKYRY